MAPITPDDAAALNRRLIELYSKAEYELLIQLAHHLEQGIDGEGWADRQLAEVQRYRRRAEQVLEKLQNEVPKLSEDASTMAYNRGSAIATTDDLARAVQPAVGEAVAGGMTAIDTFAATAMAAEMTSTLANVRPNMFRSVDDAYRRVIVDSLANPLIGTQTRREAADTALRRFAQQGITGFTDRSGRNWELSSYVEAATRGGLMNVMIEGHSDRLQHYGNDLVIVSDVPQECEKCRPFEGKVLSLSGRNQGEILVDGHRVTVLTSLRAARAAGLYHPNCRHSHGIYIPGRTRSFGETADPQGDRDRQKLRYLERCVRAAKREELVAIDKNGKAIARARVKAYQAKIREHTSTTTAKRQPHREQLSGPPATRSQTSRPTPSPKPAPDAHVPRLTGRETVDAARANTNRGRTRERAGTPESEAFHMNCQRVVQTYELRRRGYDVTAGPNRAGTPNRGDLSLEQIASAWTGPDGNAPTWRRPGATPPNSYDELRASMVSDFPEGARGTLFMAWRDLNSHVLNFEVRGGQVQFVEAQMGPRFRGGDVGPSYFADALPGSIQALRLDDATPNWETLSKYNVTEQL
jgi:hypothetical protein